MSTKLHKTAVMESLRMEVWDMIVSGSAAIFGGRGSSGHVRSYTVCLAAVAGSGPRVTGGCRLRRGICCTS